MKIKKYIKDNKSSLLFIVFFISFCLFLGLFSCKDTDYYWHIKAGEYMVKNNLILVKDVFSWSLEGSRWFSHEWLFEILLYKLKCIFPTSHIFIYTSICSFLLFFVLFWKNRKNWIKNVPFSMFWIVSSLIFYGLLTARPHMISNVLLAVCLVIYRDLFYHEDSKLIYFLPLVSLLWVNVHGGSSCLLYIIGFVFIICGLFKFKFSKIETESNRLTKKQIIKYLVCIGISILVLFINPSGRAMITYPYTNMGDSLMLTSIAEWQQTDFSQIHDLVYLAFIIIILLIFVFSKKKVKLLDFVLFGISVFLGLKSIRFWMYVYIFSSLFIFDYIKEIKRMEKKNLIILGSLAMMFIVIFITNLDMVNKNDKLVSDEMIELIKVENPKRLFNYYDYGGCLIYNNIKVFIDGRADLYTGGPLSDYYTINDMGYNYKEIIEKYDFDYYLVPEKIGLTTYLENDDRYDLLLKDGMDILLFKKK